MFKGMKVVGRTPDAGRNPWGDFRGMVESCLARCGIVCSEQPLKALNSKASVVSCTHGVQGVECSNHSVPTIYLVNKAISERDGLFHVRDFLLLLSFLRFLK